MSLRILVTGATGNQGGACINALLATSNTYTIYALTRTANSAASLKLAARGVHIIEGNLDDCASVFAKIPEPLDGVFSVQPPSDSAQTIEREERQAKDLFNAAQEAGVKHFVYSGVDRNGFKPTPCGLFAVKHRVEDYIIKNANGKIGWTFLQPVSFMDNFVNKDFRIRVFFTGVEAYTGTQKEIDLIATEDIGKVAAKVFLNPSLYNSKSIPLSGDRLALSQLQRIYEETSKANGRTTFHFLARFLFGWVIPEMSHMLIWMKEEGYSSNAIATTKEILPEVQDFRTWASRKLAPP